MLARLIATVATLLLACASPQASAYVRAERVSVSLADLAAIERSDATAPPTKIASTPKTAPPARARPAELASGKNAALSHCRVGENWSPLQQCASMPGVYQWDGTRLAGRTNATGTSLGDYQHAYGWPISSREGAERSFIHADTHGTPQLVTTATGAIAGWTRTDVWGVEKAQSGTQTRIGYTGYLKDSLLDELYAQARQYRPGSGRFTSVDPWEGDVNSPLSLNKYLYGLGNPGSFIDPDGLCPIAVAAACSYLYTRDYQGQEAANRGLQQAYPKTSVGIGVGVGVGQLAYDTVAGPVALGSAFVGSAAEQVGIRSGTESSDQLGAMVKGGVDFGSAVYEQGPIDYASTAASDKAWEIREQYNRGDIIDASSNTTQATVGTVAAVTGAYGLVRQGAKFAGRQVDNYVGKLDFDAREIDAQVYADAAPRERVVVEGGEGSPTLQIAEPGDAGFIGPLTQSWTLVPDGMGAHLVERSSIKNRPELSDFDQNDTPRYYPYGTPENAGHAHVRMHRATRSEGIRGGSGNLNGAQLLDAFGRAYSQPSLSGIRGDLRTPDSSLVVKESANPSAAYDALLEWFISKKKGT